MAHKGPLQRGIPHNGPRWDSRNRLSSIRIVSACNIHLLLLLSSLSKTHWLVSGELACIPRIKKDMMEEGKTDALPALAQKEKKT